MFFIRILEGLIAVGIVFLSRTLSTESAGACPAGWRLFSSSLDSKCYFVVQTLYMWEEAREVCQNSGARVIEVDSEEESEFIVEELINDVTFTTTNKAWLDCTNLGRSLHEWVCGPDDHELLTTYTNWKPGEPNNFIDENCLEIYPDGIWNDKECDGQRLTICERPARFVSKSITMKRYGTWPPRCLRNHVIQIIQSASLVECVSRCLATGENCLSLNHFEGTRECQLNDANDVTASADFQETNNCRYYRLLV
ncbi:CD209 antigen-like protein 2 [Lytechinus pictus]|uniref:CD209 antigen-like protein 2 n=1 Tax=Lytechinus pictus TaxID=7653 RepID=UPI0030B9DC17